MMAGANRQDEPDGAAAGEEDPPVLVAFASKHGSTRGVAQRIAARLREHGATVELRPVDQVADAGDYEAVVLGSAVFNQRWTPEAEQFVDRNTEALAARPVWLFSVGTFGDHKRIIGPLMKREPKDIRTLQDTIRPRGYRVFAGVIDRRQWPLGSRLFYHALGGRLGDNRDWADIDAWAEGIGRTLRAERSRARIMRA
jgi:menaquinone-dependent protoporphyrinogen oxidase